MFYRSENKITIIIMNHEKKAITTKFVGRYITFNTLRNCNGFGCFSSSAHNEREWARNHTQLIRCCFSSLSFPARILFIYLIAKRNLSISCNWTKKGEKERMRPWNVESVFCWQSNNKMFCVHLEHYENQMKWRKLVCVCVWHGFVIYHAVG